MKTLSLFILLSFFIYGCKKSGSSLDNGSSNQWFYKCTVDNILTNVSSSGIGGGGGLDVNGNPIENAFVASSSPTPMINITMNANCNTSANNPCLIFTARFPYIAVGKYVISDTSANNPGGQIFTMSLIPQNLTPFSEYSTTYLDIGVSNPTNVILNITHVGAVGENISGTFSGTIQKYTLTTSQLVTISGSFNVYRLD